MIGTTNVTDPLVSSSNETHIERQVLAEEDDISDEEISTTTMELPSGPSNAEELSNVFDKLIKTKHCPCPCSGVKHVPVCGKTTNGLTKDFDSQCHLICHNQCTQAESKNLFVYLVHYTMIQCNEEMSSISLLHAQGMRSSSTADARWVLLRCCLPF